MVDEDVRCLQCCNDQDLGSLASPSFSSSVVVSQRNVTANHYYHEPRTFPTDHRRPDPEYMSCGSSRISAFSRSGSCSLEPKQNGMSREPRDMTLAQEFPPRHRGIDMFGHQTHRSLLRWALDGLVCRTLMGLNGEFYLPCRVEL